MDAQPRDGHLPEEEQTLRQVKLSEQAPRQEASTRPCCMLASPETLLACAAARGPVSRTGMGGRGVSSSLRSEPEARGQVRFSRCHLTSLAPWKLETRSDHRESVNHN